MKRPFVAALAVSVSALACGADRFTAVEDAGANTVADAGTSVDDGSVGADADAGSAACAHTFCSTFDDGLPGPWSKLVAPPGTSVVTDTAVSTSPPASLLVSIPPTGAARTAAYLEKSFAGVPAKISASFRMRVDSQGDVPYEVVTFVLGPAYEIGYRWVGNSGEYVTEQYADGDGGTQRTEYYVDTAHRPKVGTWSTIELTLTLAPSASSFALNVDGALATTGVDTTVEAYPRATGLAVVLGSYDGVVNSTAEWRVHYDDVFVDVTTR